MAAYSDNAKMAWGALAAGALGGLGLLAGMFLFGGVKKGAYRLERARENAAYSRRVRGPWRNSHSHCRQLERRLSVLMRRVKRKDRVLYILYRNLRVSSMADDRLAYSKAVDAYEAYLDERKGDKR